MYAGVPTPCPLPSAAVAPRRRPQRSPPRRRRRLRRADDLGQAPVHHQRLAVVAQHDVRRLQVAVHDAPAVGVVDGVADVDEPAQQLPPPPTWAAWPPGAEEQPDRGRGVLCLPAPSP